ncbi:MAG: hypothetical protein ACPGU7_03580 [Gammaproteobacteria bacterium]
MAEIDDLIKQASEEIDAQDEEVRAVHANQNDRGKRRGSRLSLLMTTIAVLALGIAAYAFTRPPAPSLQRESTTAVDRLDRTIADMIEIGRLLSNDREPEAGRICPGTGRPYTRTLDGNRITYSCPGTLDMGYPSLTVSNQDPIPRLGTARSQ